MELKKFGELQFIEKIKKTFLVSDPDVLCGIGDDTAVLKFGSKNLLFTTDALLEKIHFDWRWTDPYLLGRKSLSVNISDIAAMGGKPRFAVVSLAIPANESLKKIEKFHQGIKECAKTYQVSIVGGDTDHSKDGWKVTIALIGEVQKPIYRSGAKINDQVWVTGKLGYSALGLKLLQKKKSTVKDLFSRIHQNPTPRIKEGKIIAEQNLASAMIDISDGLLLDLERICSASKLGAMIDIDSFPISETYQKTAQKLNVDTLQLILSGGEDYELLFTSSTKNEKKLIQVFKKIKTPLTCIGKIVSKKGIELYPHQRKMLELKQKGFLHF